VSLSLLGVEVANRARFIPALTISCNMCGHEVKAATIAIASVSQAARNVVADTENPKLN
jgi:hypothetical protein